MTDNTPVVTEPCLQVVTLVLQESSSCGYFCFCKKKKTLKGIEDTLALEGKNRFTVKMWTKQRNVWDQLWVQEIIGKKSAHILSLFFSFLFSYPFFPPFSLLSLFYLFFLKCGLPEQANTARNTTTDLQKCVSIQTCPLAGQKKCLTLF